MEIPKTEIFDTRSVVLDDQQWRESYTRRLNIQRVQISAMRKVAIIAVALSLLSNVICLVILLS